MTVTIVSACYGDLDTPIDQPPQDVDCRWVMVTRVPKPSATWENVVEPRPHLSDRQAAKFPKFRPDLYADTEIVVWFDGSVFLKSNDAVRRIIEPLDSCDIAAIPHPNWSDIGSEFRAATTQNRYAGQRIAEQGEHYLAEFSGASPPVWATAVMARRVTPETSAFGDAVLMETLRWTCHDQLSVPYVQAKLDVKMGRIEEHLWSSPHLQLRVINRPEDGE